MTSDSQDWKQTNKRTKPTQTPAMPDSAGGTWMERPSLPRVPFQAQSPSPPLLTLALVRTASWGARSRFQTFNFYSKFSPAAKDVIFTISSTAQTGWGKGRRGRERVQANGSSDPRCVFYILFCLHSGMHSERDVVDTHMFVQCISIREFHG